MVFLRQPQDDGFFNEVLVDRVIWLANNCVVNLSEQSQLQKLVAPNRFALLGVGGQKLFTDDIEHNQPLRRIDKLKHLRGSHGVDDVAEFAMSIGGNAKNLFRATAGVEVFKQTDNLAGGGRGQRLNGRRPPRREAADLAALDR